MGDLLLTPTSDIHPEGLGAKMESCPEGWNVGPLPSCCPQKPPFVEFEEVGSVTVSPPCPVEKWRATGWNSALRNGRDCILWVFGGYGT